MSPAGLEGFRRKQKSWNMKKCLFLLLYRPVSIEIHLYTSPVSFVSKANCLVYSKIGRNKSYPTTYSSKVCQNFWKFSSPTFAAWFLALNKLILFCSEIFHFKRKSQQNLASKQRFFAYFRLNLLNFAYLQVLLIFSNICFRNCFQIFSLFQAKLCGYACNAALFNF